MHLIISWCTFYIIWSIPICKSMWQHQEAAIQSTLPFWRIIYNILCLQMVQNWKWFQHLLSRLLLDLLCLIHHQNKGEIFYWQTHLPFFSTVFTFVRRFETSRSSLTPSLLKKSSITPTTGTGTSSLSPERCFGQQDSWRTMTLLQAISELCLSHVTSKESTNLQANSPHRTQINILQVRIWCWLNL